MNFCGADHDEMSYGRGRSLPHTISGSYQCGGGSCGKSDFSDNKFSPTSSRLSAMASLGEDDEVETDSERKGGGVHESKAKLPVSAALDSIQETLSANESYHFKRLQVGLIQEVCGSSVKPARSLSVSSRDDTPTGRMESSGNTMTPSPSLLNPLTRNWMKEPDCVDNPSIFFPILDARESSPSMGTLMRRLQNGFGVLLSRVNATSSLPVQHGKVWLYLHESKSQLCIEPAAKTDPKKGISYIDRAELDCWFAIPVDQILRLEVGASGNTELSFSLVVQEGEGFSTFYDFEADSAVDREVMVTTIMVALDHSHNSEAQKAEQGGTMDQPIPCSPSLDVPLLLEADQAHDQPIPCSPSLEHEHFLESSHLSPRRRTQIFSCDENAETEASLVSNFGDVSIGRTNTSKMSRKDLPVSSVQEQSDGTVEYEERHIDFKPSASSTQVTGAAWCHADSCALALNDIADTCTGIFALKQAEAACIPSMSIDQRVIVEDFIASALGAPKVVYSYFAEGGEIWNIESSGSVTEYNNVSSTRNRATLLNAQAERLRSLRREMTFSAALKQSKDRMHFVQTVQSFDDAYTHSAGTKKLRAATEAANRFHSSALLESIVNRMNPGNRRNEMLGEDEEIMYYDSDPEDSRLRTAHTGPRQVAADRLNRDSKILRPGSQGSLHGVGFESIGSGRKVSRKLDEETIVDIVHAMNNERLTLLWHPTQAKSDHNSAVCVKVWIEAGVYLNDGTFLLPKLSWSRATQEDPRKEPIEKLDLLDICRIRPTVSIDRRLHPFVLTQKSFYLETQNDMFVFQAHSISERDRIVYGLKLVIARLASLLMLRDIRAAEEFFGAITNMVPGEAPAWTNDAGNESPSATKR